jgi:hypothetical protein
MFLSTTLSLIASFTRTQRAVLAAFPIVRTPATAFLAIALTMIYRGSGKDVYNVLWAVVFGFATLNILSLAAKRTEPGRRGFTFGEMLAVMVVILSIFLLGVEMFNMLHIFPIKLRR